MRAQGCSVSLTSGSTHRPPPVPLQSKFRELQALQWPPQPYKQLHGGLQARGAPPLPEQQTQITSMALTDGFDPLQGFKFALYVALPVGLTAAVVLNESILQSIIKSVSGAWAGGRACGTTCCCCLHMAHPPLPLPLRSPQRSYVRYPASEVTDEKIQDVSCWLRGGGDGWVLFRRRRRRADHTPPHLAHPGIPSPCP